MKRFIFFWLAAVFLIGADWGSDYVDDLILKGRSDSAVKYLIPPLSLDVIQNRPAQGSNFYFIGGQKRFDTSVGLNTLDPFLSHAKTIKRTLVKTDPARLVPAKQGTDLRGPVTRKVLRSLAKDLPAELLLVFRWEVQVDSADVKTSGNGQTTQPIRLTARGLVYISSQNKLLALPSNAQTGRNLTELTQTGLKILAGEARKIIQAQIVEALIC